MIEYPSFRSAAVSTRLAARSRRTSPAAATRLLPSSPVRVIDSSHSGGVVVASPVAGIILAQRPRVHRHQRRALQRLVAIVVSWYLVQNVGDTTSHAAPDEQARSRCCRWSARRCGRSTVVNVTSAAGVTPYTAPARSPYSILDKAPPWM